jgi:peptidoglycan/xylan/chitin deacetylase (PgdA/CDA1 family)
MKHKKRHQKKREKVVDPKNEILDTMGHTEERSEISDATASYRRIAFVLFILLFLLSGFVLIRSSMYSLPSSVIRHFFIKPTLHPTATPVPTKTPVDVLSVPILMYHYVEHVADPRDTIRISLDIYPEMLDRQLTTLMEHGYTFITANQLPLMWQGNMSLDSRYVALTFDDGYRDFYTNVFPILQKHHAKATVYMISGFIGKPNYMTEEMLKEIAASGLVEVGAHTVHHIALKSEPEDVLSREIRDSKKDLEELLGIPVVSFAYPYGSYDARAEKAVADAGFVTAVTTKPGKVHMKADRYTLRRIRPGGTFGPPLLHLIDSVK